MWLYGDFGAGGDVGAGFPNGQPLLRSVAYHEIAPHIVLMAFLHRVANGGGSIEREYAIGTRRIAIALRYGSVTVGMELKVWRDGNKDPLDQGLIQLDQYLAGLGLDRGWLVIFDQRSGLLPIADRTAYRIWAAKSWSRLRNWLFG